MSPEKTKDKTVVEEDGIPVEFAKSMQNQRKKALVDVCKEIYDTSLWSKEIFRNLVNAIS